MKYTIPTLPLPYDLETKEILRMVNRANRKLAELKGVARTIPNENILISTLTLQEAKDSSEVENIVTTQDDLYKADLDIKQHVINASTKEVMNYREAIQKGFALIRQNKLLTNNVIKQIQECLEDNRAGFRSVPGTTLKRNDGVVVYTPPQSLEEITIMMSNLEQFINNSEMADLDPLIKMAIIHHQFESIHPFYDGNGRTGRIILILYLVATDLLDLPILYLSRYITHHKGEYYQLLQSIRDKEGDNHIEWEEWILFMLRGIEETAEGTMHLIQGISQLMAQYKIKMREVLGKQYNHDLLNNLFSHPYTKVEYVARDLQITRQTATKRLDVLVTIGLIEKIKLGKSNYYINNDINNALLDLFMNYRPVNNIANN